MEVEFSEVQVQDPAQQRRLHKEWGEGLSQSNERSVTCYVIRVVGGAGSAIAVSAVLVMYTLVRRWL